ncbi:MAG: class I SAM-dependent methyltransferase [Candidatus Aminicenantes bacterium]|nr:class I SAM-dependent methyltransferase [Candidatus Aminicenantes bacterium]
MADLDSYIKQLKETFPLRKPVLRSAIRQLQIPLGARVLDAGCGIGQPALLLADEVGPAGHVTAIDRCGTFLIHAGQIAKNADLSDRISFREGDLKELPFDNHQFDWAWSADCAGYPSVGEPLPLLKELSRVVKPGGGIAVIAWSSQNLLPGYPLLEARLNVTSSSIEQHMMAKSPESAFLRALGWFRETGLEEVEAQTFVGNVCAPLDDEIRAALLSFFHMLWGESQSRVSKEDWKEYRRLCLPESADFLLNLTDYYGFFTYSMFHGKVPK